jgi:hypothetical protein
MAEYFEHCAVYPAAELPDGAACRWCDAVRDELMYVVDGADEWWECGWCATAVAELGQDVGASEVLVQCF